MCAVPVIVHAGPVRGFAAVGRTGAGARSAPAPYKNLIRPVTRPLRVIHTARLGGVSRMTPLRSTESGARASVMPSLSRSQVDLGAQEHSEHEAKKAAVRAGQISSSTSQLQR